MFSLHKDWNKFLIHTTTSIRLCYIHPLMDELFLRKFDEVAQMEIIIERSVLIFYFDLTNLIFVS